MENKYTKGILEYDLLSDKEITALSIRMKYLMTKNPNEIPKLEPLGFIVKSYNNVPILMRTPKQELDYEFKAMVRWAVRHPNRKCRCFDTELFWERVKEYYR